MLHTAASDLGLHCFLMSLLREASHKWVKSFACDSLICNLPSVYHCLVDGVEIFPRPPQHKLGNRKLERIYQAPLALIFRQKWLVSQSKHRSKCSWNGLIKVYNVCHCRNFRNFTLFSILPYWVRYLLLLTPSLPIKLPVSKTVTWGRILRLHNGMLSILQ